MHHFAQQACALGHAAAIGILALVAAAAQKLVYQVAVGRVHFHAVKACCDGVTRSAAVVGHDAGHLLEGQGPWRRGGHKLGPVRADQHGLGFGGEGRGRHRRLPAFLQVHMRYTAHMPKLHKDAPARCVYGSSHWFPRLHLRLAPDAGHVRIALALLADGGGLADDEGRAAVGVSTLGVVARHAGVGQGTGGAVACQGGHDHAVGQGQKAHREGVKKLGHEGCLSGVLVRRFNSAQ